MRRRPSTRVPARRPDGEPLDFYEAVVHATADTLPLVRELQPDVVVADILTLAPALAAELCERPRATLVPHVYPENAPDAPDLLARRAPAAHRRPAARCGAARSGPVATGSSAAGSS